MLQSTREGHRAPSSLAILQGLAPDGGLFVPEKFHTLSMNDIIPLCPLSYAERAQRILPLLLDDYSEAEIAVATEAAYGARFGAGGPAPLRKLNGNTSLLELYHGPTLAFKDVALQILPHLMAMAARKNGTDDEICLLAATSGDTGIAALEGFGDIPGTRCVVFYPRDGVSRAQYLQMATQAGRNTHVIAVEGNFDDVQTGVKRIFADPEFAERMRRSHRMLSSANSINYGRLAPQVVYYFSAYADLLARGAIAPGEPVHFVVPTGNFGNILAAIYAQNMGLPIGKLFCASNANRILADFIQTGTYDINRSFHKTESPSMDILISSNLERYLFELAGHEGAQISGWMRDLAERRRYKLPKALHLRMRETLQGGWVSDEEARTDIARVRRETGALIDPHTAVASALLARYRRDADDRTQAVVVGTASPYKFGRAVAKALEINERDEFRCCERIAKAIGGEVPAQIRTLERAEIRHTATCMPDAMPQALLAAFDAAT